MPTPDGQRPRWSWPGYTRDGILALLGLVTLALLIVALFFPDLSPFRRPASFQAPASITSAEPSPRAPLQPSPSATALAPTLAPAAAASPDPTALVLRVSDLAPGYRVRKAGPVLFGTGVGLASPASWDVVFVPDGSRPTWYLMIESVVAVYADASAAMAAVQAEEATERRASRAVRQASIPGLGSVQAVWLELAPDRPGYGTIRVTWQSLNVVGQVAALGPIDPSEPQQTGSLAVIEQSRITAAR